MRSPIINIPVPDTAGKSESKDVSGRSVRILRAPSVTNLENAALVSFDDRGYQFPLVTGGQWPAAEWFESVKVTATEETAGGLVQLIPLPVCADVIVGGDYGGGGSTKAKPGNTQVKAMDDTVQELTVLDIADDDGNVPEEVLISAAGTGDILFRWNNGTGTDPAADGDQSHLLKNGAEPMAILGEEFIKNNLKIVNAVLGETPNFVYSRRFQL